MEIKEELKVITRRAEETLSIIIEHFKDMEERMEELEEKIERLENGERD
jgi:tetrahydromethanopterin S-methyltransferase subunit B